MKLSLHRAVGLAAALLATPLIATAQASYPDRPIKLIVPYAPGGSVDIVARLVADAWAAGLRQPFVIDNKGGAGGNIGVDAVAKASPDGYTIGIQSVSLAINPALYPRMPFDTMKDLAPVGMVATSQHVLVVNPQLPAKNVKELIALAKAKPGGLNYASAGPGSTFHMSAELFKSLAGVEIVHVPYRGGGPALADTMAGQVNMSFPVLSAAQQQIQTGKLRALGVTGSKRAALLPNVPTIAEAGLPQYDFQTWFMVFAPAKTPQAVIDKLNTTLNKTLGSKTLVERMVKQGYDPLLSTVAEARERLAKEAPAWAKLVKERGITAE